MSRPRFDSAHMLPLFRIIAPNNESNMNGINSSANTADIHHKHKRKSKRPDVPVHLSNGDYENSDIAIRKSGRKNKSKHKNERVSFENDEQDSTNIQKPKIKRKHLLKENERILTQNEKLIEQLQYVQTVLDKKDLQIIKLKEKYASVQNINKEIANENNIIKTQYEDIVVHVEEFKTKMKNMKCGTCEELQNILKTQNKQLDTAKSANKELNEDLNMLKNVIYRLNVQLERYQQKLKPNALTSSNTINNSLLTEIEQDHQRNELLTQQIDAELANQHSGHLHTPISWGDVNSHTLGPLLDAYQDTIKEKEDIIEKYEFELVSFTDKLKRVIDENEIMHRKCVEDSEVLEKNIAELEANRKELKVTKDQNDLLIKKCALKHDKLQEICKVYDHKIECIKRDYEVLQDQYHKTRVEYSSLQAKYQALVETNDSLKSDKQNVIPLSVHTTSVNECKRLFEELKIQYESEKAKYVNQIKLLEDQSKVLEAKVIEIGSEKRDLLIKVKSAEKQIKKLETKLSESHNSLTHTQISRDACKRQLSKAIEFGKELVTEQESLLQQLSSRHKENKAVKQIGCNIVNRMDMLKSQLKTVQKDAYQQLASVEQRIQEQDSSMESMRRDHENEVGKLLQQIHDKDKYISKLIDQTSTLPPAPYLLYREKHMHVP